jgi:hypothetical protein
MSWRSALLVLLVIAAALAARYVLSGEPPWPDTWRWQT